MMLLVWRVWMRGGLGLAHLSRMNRCCVARRLATTSAKAQEARHAELRSHILGPSLPNSDLVLIDGNSLVYRYYYGTMGANLTSPSGQGVSALYSFCRSLLRIIATIQPSAIAVCFDNATPSFRATLFPEYKANRDKSPDEVIEQLRLCEDAVRRLLGPQHSVRAPDGFEADDVLATYAHAAALKFVTGEEEVLTAKACNPMSVAVVTSDKDMMQLVNDEACVCLYRPSTQSVASAYQFPFNRVRETDVRKAFGVDPHLVPHVQALMGDSSDNIPGVRGIGVKTAAKMMAAYGSIQGLIDTLDSLNPAEIENLQEAEARGWEGAKLPGAFARHTVQLKQQEKELATLLELTTLDRNTPLEAPLDKLSLQKIKLQEAQSGSKDHKDDLKRWERIEQFVEQYAFGSLDLSALVETQQAEASKRREGEVCRRDSDRTATQV